MNIKQAETLSGVSRPNIRFYEKQGLLNPARNPENDYREYSQTDVETLKWIRTMRMLDMPLEDIAKVLNGSLSLSQAAQKQQVRLKAQAEKLDEAIRFCGTLQTNGDIQTLNVDDCLRKMEEGGVGYFQQWKKDFLAVAEAEGKQYFTFTPDEAITNAGEFAEALQAFADENSMVLDITKISMYPVFTLDGVEYTARREYRRTGGYGVSVPVAVVECEMTHPEEVEPDMDPKRRKSLKRFYRAMPFLLFFSLFLLAWLPELIQMGSLDGWVGFLGTVLLVVSIAAMIGVGTYLFRRFHFNDKTKH